MSLARITGPSRLAVGSGDASLGPMDAELIVGLIATLVVLYLLASLLAFLAQRRLIFPAPAAAPQPPPGTSAESIVFEHDGLRFTGWMTTDPAPRHPGLLLYCGGNAEEVSWNLETFGALGVGHVALVNYRGYAGTAGKPSEKALVADTAALLDHLQEQTGTAPGRTVLMGRSLGTGVAVQVARSRKRLAGLLLITPLASVTRLAKRSFFLLPVGLILRHRFDNLEVAKRTSLRAEIIIAGEDEVIPPGEARLLAETWNGPVETVELATAGHGNVHEDPGYLPALQAALDRLLPPET